MFIHQKCINFEKTTIINFKLAFDCGHNKSVLPFPSQSIPNRSHHYLQHTKQSSGLSQGHQCHHACQNHQVGHLPFEQSLKSRKQLCNLEHGSSIGFCNYATKKL